MLMKRTSEQKGESEGMALAELAGAALQRWNRVEPPHTSSFGSEGSKDWGRTCRSRSPWDNDRRLLRQPPHETEKSKLINRDRMDPSSYGNGTERRGPSKGMANYSPPSAYEISTYQVLNKPTPLPIFCLFSFED